MDRYHGMVTYPIVIDLGGGGGVPACMVVY